MINRPFVVNCCEAQMEDSSANVNPRAPHFLSSICLHSADGVYYPESNERRFSPSTENDRHVRNMCLGAERHANNVLPSWNLKRNSEMSDFCTTFFTGIKPDHILGAGRKQLVELRLHLHSRHPFCSLILKL